MLILLMFIQFEINGAAELWPSVLFIAHDEQVTMEELKESKCKIIFLLFSCRLLHAGNSCGQEIGNEIRTDSL